MPSLVSSHWTQPEYASHVAHDEKNRSGPVVACVRDGRVEGKQKNMDNKERDELLEKLAELVANEIEDDNTDTNTRRKRARSETPDVDSDTDGEDASGVGDALSREVQEYILLHSGSEETRSKRLHTCRMAACAYIMESVHDVSTEEENSDSDSESEEDDKDAGCIVSHRLRRYLRATEDNKGERLRSARVAACAFILDTKHQA